jgi:cytochrome c-type biogenesis protein CcsB
MKRMILGVVLGLAAVVCTQASVLGQYAPPGGAGNTPIPDRPVVLPSTSQSAAGAGGAASGREHPQTHALAKEGMSNPFGPPNFTVVSQAEKMAFARQVNLEPLRDLSLYHNGRLKILGTLANDVIGEIADRRNLIEYVPEMVDGQQKWRKVHVDPLFSFMDMVIDPQYSFDKPIIGINYLPLREALLELAYPGNSPEAQATREQWKRIGRVPPQMISDFAAGLYNSGTTDQQINKGLNDINEAVGLYVRSAGALLMVPSDAKDKPWSPIEGLPAGHPVRTAALELGSAWRAMDAARVNSAISVLAAELPKINPGTYPTTRRSLEAFYNKANLFEWGMWLYAVAMLALMLAFGTGRSWLRYSGVALLLLAVAAHFTAFGLRSYIAERYAIQNQFESMTGVSLFAAIVGLGLLVFKRQMIFAAAAAGTGFLVLCVATQTGIPGKDVDREAAILNTSVLLKYHVTTVLFSYGLITLGLIVSLFYLGTHYAQKFKAAAAGGGASGGTSGGGSVGGSAVMTAAIPAAGAVGIAGVGDGGGADAAAAPTARVLHDLDKAHMTILQLGFWTLGVGILLGAWWADHSWGRWWAFDPKELWALITWIVYLVVIHIRKAGIKNPGLVTAWLGVLGFLVMLWCYFGVNLLLPGLHAYA